MTRALHRRCKGFTLTELAVVMVFVAVLMGGLLIPLSAQRDAQAYRETQIQLDEIREALIGFAVTNGRLPRPATSINNGLENPTPCTMTSCQGYIPWATLGIRKTDAWGKMIHYSVTPAFANTSFGLSTIGRKKIESRDSTGNEIYLVGSASLCAADSPCAPAVVYSFGKHNWGTSSEGAALTDASTTNVDEDTNNAAGDIYFVRDQTDNASATGGEFDDLVVWISPYILFNRMIAAGKLP